MLLPRLHVLLVFVIAHILVIGRRDLCTVSINLKQLVEGISLVERVAKVAAVVADLRVSHCHQLLGCFGPHERRHVFLLLIAVLVSVGLIDLALVDIENPLSASGKAGHRRGV